jgi:hypothetical protein
MKNHLRHLLLCCLILVIPVSQGCRFDFSFGRNSPSIKIDSFSQGKIRQIKEDAFEIYEEHERGRKMIYEENNLCMGNSNEIPCMYYGFFIEYEVSGRGVFLECSYNQHSAGCQRVKSVHSKARYVSRASE